MEGVEAWSRAVTTRAMPRCAQRARVFRLRPIARWREALGDPQIAHRGALAEVEDGGGTLQGSQPAVPHVRAPGSRRRKRMSTLGEHTRRLSEGDRAFGGRNRGLCRQAAGGSARADATRCGARYQSCGFSSAVSRRPCRAPAIPDNLAAQSSTIRNTGRTGTLGGNINESGNPFARACAIISCGGIWRLALSGGPASAQKQGGSITMGLELDIPGFDPLKVGVFDTAALTAAAATFRHADLSRRQGRAAAEACAVLDPFGGLQDLDLQAAARRQVPRRHAVQCRSVQGEFRPAERSRQQMPLRLLYRRTQQRGGAGRTDAGLQSEGSVGELAGAA